MMIKRPPNEKQWLSWLYVAVWSLCIFSVIPMARLIQQYVYQTWGRDLFTYGVISVTIIALAVAVVYVYRNRPESSSSYFWLIAVAGIFFVYTLELAKRSSEESVHFVLFGVLGVLVYRALTHRLKDASIFIAGAIICGCIGIIDEFIQWMTLSLCLRNSKKPIRSEIQIIRVGVINRLQPRTADVKIVRLHINRRFSRRMPRRINAGRNPFAIAT